MGQSSGSAGDREETGRSNPVSAGGASPAHRPQDRRWPWVIVIAAGVALKGAALASAVHHRASWLVLLSLLSLVSLLRAKPLALALFAAPLLAFAIDPHSVLVGVAVGVGAFFALIVLFAALGTALNMRDAHTSAARTRRP
jgi:uncharacterized membrane protein (DUF485 family)